MIFMFCVCKRLGPTMSPQPVQMCLLQTCYKNFKHALWQTDSMQGLLVLSTTNKFGFWTGRNTFETICVVRRFGNQYLYFMLVDWSQALHKIYPSAYRLRHILNWCRPKCVLSFGVWFPRPFLKSSWPWVCFHASVLISAACGLRTGFQMNQICSFHERSLTGISIIPTTWRALQQGIGSTSNEDVRAGKGWKKVIPAPLWGHVLRRPIWFPGFNVFAPQQRAISACTFCLATGAGDFQEKTQWFAPSLTFCKCISNCLLQMFIHNLLHTYSGHVHLSSQVPANIMTR